MIRNGKKYNFYYTPKKETTIKALQTQAKIEQINKEKLHAVIFSQIQKELKYT